MTAAPRTRTVALVLALGAAVALSVAGADAGSAATRQSPPPVAASVAEGCTVAEGCVARLYRAFFLRRPDAEGFRYWVRRYEAGWDLGTIASVFAGSGEFLGTYGHLGDEAYLELVYRNVLGRGTDEAGRRYWLPKLVDGSISRGDLMVNFSESAEFRDRVGMCGEREQPGGVG